MNDIDWTETFTSTVTAVRYKLINVLGRPYAYDCQEAKVLWLEEAGLEASQTEPPRK